MSTFRIDLDLTAEEREALGLFLDDTYQRAVAGTYRPGDPAVVALAALARPEAWLPGRTTVSCPGLDSERGAAVYEVLALAWRRAKGEAPGVERAMRLLVQAWASFVFPEGVPPARLVPEHVMSPGMWGTSELWR